jgi:hypothetical protein
LVVLTQGALARPWAGGYNPFGVVQAFFLAQRACWHYVEEDIFPEIRVTFFQLLQD